MRGGGLQQAVHGGKGKTTIYDVVKCQKSCTHPIHGILSYVVSGYFKSSGPGNLPRRRGRAMF